MMSKEKYAFKYALKKMGTDVLVFAAIVAIIFLLGYAIYSVALLFVDKEVAIIPAVLSPIIFMGVIAWFGSYYFKGEEEWSHIHDNT